MRLLTTTLHNATLFAFCPSFINFLLRTYVKNRVFGPAAADESGENPFSFCCKSKVNCRAQIVRMRDNDRRTAMSAAKGRQLRRLPRAPQSLQGKVNDRSNG